MTASSSHGSSTLPIWLEGENHKPPPEETCNRWGISYSCPIAQWWEDPGEEVGDWEGWMGGSKRQYHRAGWETLCQKCIKWNMSPITILNKLVQQLRLTISSSRCYGLARVCIDAPPCYPTIFAYQILELGRGNYSTRTNPRCGEFPPHSRNQLSEFCMQETAVEKAGQWGSRELDSCQRQLSCARTIFSTECHKGKIKLFPSMRSHHVCMEKKNSGVI